MADTKDNNITATIHTVIDWVQARLSERDSWDGATVIIVSLVLLVLSPLMIYGAWLGLAYGIWLLWKRGSLKRLIKGGDTPSDLRG